MLVEGILITLSYLLIFETDGLKNYVTPNKTAQCSNDWINCLTLKGYASQTDDYFKNNTIFQFEPGNHTLNRSLTFINLHNFTLLGKRSKMTNVLLGPLVYIIWENCSNIDISSLSFIILEDFTFSIIFINSNLVQLSDVSVSDYGNEGNIGCSSVLSQYSTLHIKDSQFAGIQGSIGAAMMILRSCVIFTGNNIFSDNSALYGGSLYISDSVVILSGINITFMNNTSPEDTFDSRCLSLVDDVDDSFRGSGGAIYCRSSTLSINSDYAVFANNSANSFGGAISSWDGNITIKGSVTFMENIAYEYEGGALFLLFVTLIVSGDISFIKNKAEFGGGALSMNQAKFILIVDEGRVASEKFIFNDASDLDVCRSVAMNGTTTSIDSEYVRVLDSYNCNFNDSDKGMAMFYENMAIIGGGIKCEYDCDITIFDGSICFENNSAMFGGGMYLGDSSRIIISSSIPNAFSFVLNRAHRFGGALYVGNSQCSTHPRECFLSIYGDDSSTATKSLLLFLNNSAGLGGSILYGGQLNKCRLRFISNARIDKYGNRVTDYIYQYDLDALVIFKTISRISESESASSIASNPEQMKFCQLDGIPKNQTLNLYVYPGEEFNISVIALDQTGSPVPTTVFVEKGYHEYYYKQLMDQGDDNKGYYYFAQLMDNGDNFAELMDKYRLSPSRQSINSHFCTNLTYKLYSAYEDTTVYFHLYHENPCQNLVYGLRLNIFIEPCPLGFELAKNQQCHCNKRLLKFTQICSVDKSTATIEREKNNFWISQTDFDVLVIHEFRCPLDYCKDISEGVILSDPSVQCDFNRTGIVCGQCRKNFSLALGSLHCISCNNKYTALILFFMMAGVVLIAIIFLFRLTVSVGTLSGLFFYVNIIQANHQAYFPRTTMNFFTTFISWLNLDLGVETCFYDGMDIYIYSWFQFLFSLYVWFLIGCIILACHYSQSIAKRLGKNPVAVLATLLLMSYSKILGATIAPLTWTYLTYYTKSNETRSVVWMYDASIPYFGEPKHIALGLFAILCLAVLVLPYILLLLTGHWLQGCSNWWILSWLNKVKPFMDAYHAPYRKHTRYWTGLLLISRLGLFLTFAINANGSESVNILAVSSVSIALLAIQRRVYQHWLKDALESSFLLNLGIFSVATFYLKEEPENDESQLILSSISVGIAFITFLGILLFHISLVLKSSNIWKNYMLLPFIQKSLLLSKILRTTPVKDQTRAGDKDAAELQAVPTSTEIDVDLREPLLEITESQATA